MAHYPDTTDLRLLNLYIKDYKYKFLLMGTGYVIMDLEPEVVEGSFKISSQSDIRRTLDVTFCIKNGSTIREALHLGRSLIVEMGQKDLTADQYIWYRLGHFEFSNTTYSYEESSNSLSLSCVDLMSHVIHTPIRNALHLVVEANRNIKQTMISFVRDLCGVKQFDIDSISPYYDRSLDTIPYELKYSVGASCYDPIKEMRDLYPGWDTYFDNEIFVCGRTPTCAGDDIVISAKTLRPLVKSENRATDLESVKNITEVWGKEFEAEYYFDDCTLENDVYYASVEDNLKLQNNGYIAIKIPGINPDFVKIKLNDQEPYPIYQYTYNGDDQTEDPLQKGLLLAGQTYVFRFFSDKLYYLGQYQVHAITALVSNEPDDVQKLADKTAWNCTSIHYVVNPDSPYTVEKIGERWNVLSGEDFSKVYSDDLAQERADYENFLTCRLNDCLSLQMLIIPWLDVNQKVEYQTIQDGETNPYITKDIRFDFSSGLMTVELMRFYEDWTHIIGDSKNKN